MIIWFLISGSYVHVDDIFGVIRRLHPAFVHPMIPVLERSRKHPFPRPNLTAGQPACSAVDFLQPGLLRAVGAG